MPKTSRYTRPAPRAGRKALVHGLTGRLLEVPVVAVDTRAQTFTTASGITYRFADIAVQPA